MDFTNSLLTSWFFFLTTREVTSGKKEDKKNATSQTLCQELVGLLQLFLELGNPIFLRFVKNLKFFCLLEIVQKVSFLGLILSRRGKSFDTKTWSFFLQFGHEEGSILNKSNQIKSNQIKSNQIKSNQIKSKQKTNQNKMKITDKIDT